MVRFAASGETSPHSRIGFEPTPARSRAGVARMTPTAINLLGFAAASLVLATFCAKSMVTLRILAMCSTVTFVLYAIEASLWPILLLHVAMFPLNLFRLREALGAGFPLTRPHSLYVVRLPASRSGRPR